jgi:hypothetical protein
MMAYLKINGVDYSPYIKKLKVDKAHYYEMKSSAGGKDRVTPKYTRRTVEVTVIVINDEVMQGLLTSLANLRNTISFRNPETNTLVDMDCIVEHKAVEYFTIQENKVLYQEFNLVFTEVNYIGEVTG